MLIASRKGTRVGCRVWQEVHNGRTYQRYWREHQRYKQERKLMAISPSGMDYFETEPEDVVIMDLEGEIVDGFRKPSSEWRMHLIFYQRERTLVP